MKTFTHLLCVLILSIVLFACNNVHFLKEESYQNQVAQDFEQKKQALPHGDLFIILVLFMLTWKTKNVFPMTWNKGRILMCLSLRIKILCSRCETGVTSYKSKDI